MLHEAEELGIKILVLYQLNLLSRSAVDVDLSFIVPAELLEEFLYELEGEPFQFIPDNIFEFYDRYRFLEKYPATQKSYDDINPRFWAATTLYERMINSLSQHAREVKTNKTNQAKSSNKLKNLVKNKK